MINKKLNISENLYLKVKEWGIESEAVLNFLNKHYHHGDLIYPKVLHNELKIDLQKIYEILDKCVEQQILEPYYEICCPNCQHSYTYDYNELDIDHNEDEKYCNHCDSILYDVNKYKRKIYKV